MPNLWVLSEMSEVGFILVFPIFFHSFSSVCLMRAKKGHLGSYLKGFFCCDGKLLMSGFTLNLGGGGVLGMFGSVLLYIVTLNRCWCKILHNNSEFPMLA